MTSTTTAAVVIVKGGIVTKREGAGSWTGGVGGWCHFRCSFDDVFVVVSLCFKRATIDERGAACQCTLDGALTAGCSSCIILYLYIIRQCVLFACLLRCHHCMSASEPNSMKMEAQSANSFFRQ